MTMDTRIELPNWVTRMILPTTMSGNITFCNEDGTRDFVFIKTSCDRLNIPLQPAEPEPAPSKFKFAKRGNDD